jgi:hypothetical protein
MKLPYTLSVMLLLLMIGQAVLGLVFPEQYRDLEWIRATWFGNDWVTLALAVPLLSAGLLLEQGGSVRGRLLGLGVLGYGVYNYAFYLFGAALNAFLPLYILLFLLSVTALIFSLSRINVSHIATRFDSRTPVRIIGGYLVFVAFGLVLVWLGMWAAHIFGGQPTPVEPEAFKLVVALDLTLMVPALASGGVLLWRGHPWGYVISAIASIQGTLYLIVLAVNGVILSMRGLVKGPTDVPIWGTLAAATAVATVLLLSHVRRE